MLRASERIPIDLNIRPSSRGAKSGTRGMKLNNRSITGRDNIAIFETGAESVYNIYSRYKIVQL